MIDGMTELIIEESLKPKKPPILCLDFDGVLHSYKSGWQGPRTIPDPPVNGAIEWLKSLLGVADNEGIGPSIKTFQVCIYSSRSKYIGGRRAMKKWLKKYGMTKYQIELIKFPLFKPAAFLTIDDRCFQFMGVFPDEEGLLEFKPWYKNLRIQDFLKA